MFQCSMIKTSRLFSVIICAIATEDVYGPALYMLMPNMAPENGTQLADLQSLLPDIEVGTGRTAREQARLPFLLSVWPLARLLRD